MSTVGIGQLARRSGVPIDTVQRYERIGLLKSAARLASGYRHYGEAEQKRLRFIRRAKALGFTLDEISDLLALSATPDVAQIRQAAGERLADVERRVQRLGCVRERLRRLIGVRPGHGRAEDCPILNALSRESGL